MTSVVTVCVNCIMALAIVSMALMYYKQVISTRRCVIIRSLRSSITQRQKYRVCYYLLVLTVVCNKPLQVYEGSGVLYGVVEEGTINLYVLYLNDNSKVDIDRIKLEGFHKGRFTAGQIWKCNLDQLGIGFGDAYIAVEPLESGCEPQIYQYHSSSMRLPIYFSNTQRLLKSPVRMS